MEFSINSSCFYFLAGLVFIPTLNLSGSLVLAQITPDNTLGAESSQVNSNSGQTDINGGAIREKNLFHSFSEFNVPEAETVNFNHPENVTNIFSRVTGDNSSNILGDISVAGAANLFLINPNGIIFGEKAGLNLNGSFVATTANSINFADGSQFTANPASNQSLLTVSVPLGLQFGEQPGTIINRAQSAEKTFPNKIPNREQFNSLGNPAGLKIKANQSLALIGGEIVLQGGNITATGGNIYLGSVASNSLVNFNLTEAGLNFDYSNVANFSDITITDRAGTFFDFITQNFESSPLRSILDAFSSDTTGSINLQGRKIDILNGSFLNTLTLNDLSGGDININATEQLKVSGFTLFGGRSVDPIPSGIFTVTNDKGNAGNLTIKTPKFLLQNRAVISTSAIGTFSLEGNLVKIAEGDAGNISIQAQSVHLDNQAAIFATTLQSDGGNINLQIDNNLELRNQSNISTSVGGTGNGGNINITAEFVLTSPEDNSDLTATAELGRGGNITIKTAGLFGINFSEQITDFSDITVSSNFGLDGTFTLLSYDPQLKTIEADSNLEYVPETIDFTPNYCYLSKHNRYIQTGRGGIPLVSKSSLVTEYTWEDWRIIDDTNDTARANELNSIEHQETQSTRVIQPIQGWMVNQQGEIVLTADPIMVTPHSPVKSTSGC